MTLNDQFTSSVRSGFRAFTLVELLVVVALIGVVVGVVGLASRSPGGGVALQAAQATLASLCNAARGRAVLAGQNARLVVAADPSDADCYLRYLLIVGEEEGGSDNWRAEGGGVYLPRGVYVVPPAPVAVPGNPAWPASCRSTALSSTAQTMTINGVTAGTFYHTQFTSRGTAGGGYLLLTAGRVTIGSSGAMLEFDNPDNIRGVLLRPSGAFTLLNDAGAFAP
jgi:prepilin-type N-terminal cleavage/methylation domain-containing protein